MRHPPRVRRALRAGTTIFGLQLALVAATGAAGVAYGLLTIRDTGALRREHDAELHRLAEALAQAARAVEDAEDGADWRVAVATDELERFSADARREAAAVATGERVAELHAALAALASSGSDLLVARGLEERAMATRRFRDVVELVRRQLRACEDALAARATAAYERCIRALLAGGGLAFAIYVGGAAWLRRKALAREARRVEDLRRSAATLAAELDASVRGEPARPPEIAPGLELVAAASDRARATLDRTRDTLRFERHRAHFSHDLVEALDLSEDEPEVCATVARAAAAAFPRTAFQLLLADNSHARLTPRLATSPACCAPQTPHACPALRRSRTLLHPPEAGIARCPRLEARPDAVACAAISVHGRSVGVAQLVGAGIDATSLETLTGMSFSVGARLGVVRTLGERELAAATDPLTGLANRRAMNERLAALDRSETPYSVVSADLDHFKRLNDTYGHEVGDRCLRVFSQVLRDACRGEDRACRPGGEEFALVLSGTDAEGALVVADRVHALLADATRRAGVAFTVSLGVAARPAHGDRAEDVLRAADAALYAAKAAGRNCTRTFAVAGVPSLASVG